MLFMIDGASDCARAIPRCFQNNHVAVLASEAFDASGL
jgi:hypothetical protein